MAYVGGLSGITVKSVSCGDSFTACLSDHGILMTFGGGAQGCLGHGDYEDVQSPRIVEELLGFEVKQVEFPSFLFLRAGIDSFKSLFLLIPIR